MVRWDRATGAVTVDGELPDVTYYATPVDGERALLGLAQGVAQVWIAHREGTPCRGSTGRSAARHPAAARLPACGSRAGTAARGECT